MPGGRFRLPGMNPDSGGLNRMHPKDARFTLYDLDVS